jgi:hypothetical protein
MARKNKPELVVGVLSDVRRVNYQYGLNLRAEPSTDSAVMKVFRYNEDVETDPTVKTPDGWVAVKGGGYCMEKYLK